MTGGRVVGARMTGRNMAAGMSGGNRVRAWPRTGQGQHRDGRAAALEPEDLSWLRDVIAKHAAYTDSTVATRCSPTGQGAARNSPRSCPPTTSGAFGTRMAKAEGRDVDTAIMDASRG